MCPASTGASSAVLPVSTLTTPAGTSEVASTSASVTAGSGRRSLATTTAVLPVAITGARTLTSPSRLEPAGASTATTPVGSGTLKLKYGPATGLAAPATWATLSVQPAYQTQRSIAAATGPRGRAGRSPSAVGDLGGELRGPALHHLGDPVQHLAAVVGGRARPPAERAPGGDDRVPRRPCATPARRRRAASPPAAAPGRTGRTPSAGTRRR